MTIKDNVMENNVETTENRNRFIGTQDIEVMTQALKLVRSLSSGHSLQLCLSCRPHLLGWAYLRGRGKFRYRAKGECWSGRGRLPGCRLLLRWVSGNAVLGSLSVRLGDIR